MGEGVAHVAQLVVRSSNWSYDTPIISGHTGTTITFPTVKTLLERDQPYTYGRKGTPTSRALETAIAALEGGHDCKVSSSGLAAVTTTLLAFLKAGEHVLIPTAPAILNAICHATGVLVRKVPATPDRVLKAIREGE